MATQSSLLDILKRQNSIVGQGAVLLLDNMRIGSSEKMVLWCKNTSETQGLHLSQLVVGIQFANMSSVSSISVEGRLYVATFEPTANFVPVPIVNMDSTNLVPAAGILYGWDGVGNGMVTPFQGVYGGNTVFNSNMFSFDFQGASVIAPGLSFAITLRTTNTSPDAVCNVNFTTYYQDVL